MATYKYLNNSGVVVADTSDTRAEVEQEFLSAFGEDLDVSAETPQGVLITAETLARQSVINNNAALANQINPNQAGGVFLDAIWALTGGNRIKATRSIVRSVVLTGRPSTLIPSGSIASTSEDNGQFKLISSVIIGNDGTVTGDFESVEYGAIPALKNTLNTIITGVLGWETVTNPEAAELGKNEESDLAARLRRRNTLALQGVALPEAITSGLYDVDGVKSLQFLENYTNQSMTVETVKLAPHSIYVCVDGGSDDDIAKTLLRKKSLGCGWNGKQTVSVIDEVSNQTYKVQFDRPDYITIFAKVTIKDGSTVNNPEQAIREAILSYANGEMEGEMGFTVGSDVSPFELSGAINRLYPTIFVSNILLSTDGQNYSSSEININVSEKATIVSGSIGVEVTKNSFFGGSF